jgi:V/A-type H+-transporting ATPase subunit E
MMTDQQAASYGVEELITRLKEKGVLAGQQEAAKLIKEAQQRADWLIAQAQQEADHLIKEAKASIAREHKASEEALRMAARDVQLHVKETLVTGFSEQLERLVCDQVLDDQLLAQMILELVGQAKTTLDLDNQAQITLLLPEQKVGLAELRNNPKAYNQDVLSHFVQALTGEQLRQGITLATHDGTGIKVRLREQAIEVELTDQTLTALLLAHLQPRYRALLEGVIRS